MRIGISSHFESPMELFLVTENMAFLPIFRTHDLAFLFDVKKNDLCEVIIVVSCSIIAKTENPCN